MADYNFKSKLGIAREDLEQAKFKKTNDEKIAVRVGNEADSPLFCSLVTPYGSVAISIYDDTLSVPENTVTKLIEYVVAPGKVFKLYDILVSGDNIAKYTVKINGVVNKVLRTHYSSGLNETFKYDYLRLGTGDKLEVFVISKIEGNSDYDVTIEGELGNE